METTRVDGMSSNIFKQRLMEVLNEANLLQLEEIRSLKLVDMKSGDEAEMSSMDKDKQFDLRLKSREATYIKKVKEALRRIDEGTFGKCMECDADISLSRLKARPTAHLCIGCKEEEERAEQQIYETEVSGILKNVIALKSSEEMGTHKTIVMDEQFDSAGNF